MINIIYEKKHKGDEVARPLVQADMEWWGADNISLVGKAAMDGVHMGKDEPWINEIAQHCMELRELVIPTIRYKKMATTWWPRLA